jgi:hypothetical protein
VAVLGVFVIQTFRQRRYTYLPTDPSLLASGAKTDYD